MILFFQIIFWISFLGLFHTYLLYPLLLRWLAAGKKAGGAVYSRTDDLPFVSVLMAVYNEEKVLKEKLDALLQLNYPPHKLKIFIGSDASSDQTNTIGLAYSARHQSLHFYAFADRRGKPSVINELAELATSNRSASSNHVFLLTDASVMPTPDCLYHLAKHFKRRQMAVVDAHMQHVGLKNAGISRPENQYISREVQIKHFESLVWEKMIGPFGGCFAIRSNFFTPIPGNFLVDDFYITMCALEKGGLAINDLNAICYEGVSHEIAEEFRRKARISAGNFQNLIRFHTLWWPPLSGLQFAFFSHKVLRWMGPFLMLVALIGLIFLSLSGVVTYQALLILFLVGGISLPVLDFLLGMVNVNFRLLRNIRYFVYMNWALLVGFYRFVKGVRSNVWEPTKREEN